METRSQELLSILLVFFSQRCQGRLRCGTVRTLTGTHLWHTNTQTSARSGSSQHNYMTGLIPTEAQVRTSSAQWCRACLVKNKQRKKTLLFHGRASCLCYDGSTNPYGPHTFILCTLLYQWGRTTATVSKHMLTCLKPITAIKCELVILMITDLYTVVWFIPIQHKCVFVTATHYRKLCGQYRLYHLPRLQTH